MKVDEQKISFESKSGEGAEEERPQRDSLPSVTFTPVCMYARVRVHVTLALVFRRVGKERLSYEQTS